MSGLNWSGLSHGLSSSTSRRSGIASRGLSRGRRSLERGDSPRGLPGGSGRVAVNTCPHVGHLTSRPSTSPGRFSLLWQSGQVIVSGMVSSPAFVATTVPGCPLLPQSLRDGASQGNQNRRAELPPCRALRPPVSSIPKQFPPRIFGEVDRNVIEVCNLSRSYGDRVVL